MPVGSESGFDGFTCWCCDGEEACPLQAAKRSRMLSSPLGHLLLLLLLLLLPQQRCRL